MLSILAAATQSMMVKHMHLEAAGVEKGRVRLCSFLLCCTHCCKNKIFYKVGQAIYSESVLSLRPSSKAPRACTLAGALWLAYS